MAELDETTPATLYRSRAEWPDQRAGAAMEAIGSGPLAKMVRLALGDPDGELWPYRVSAGGEVFEGVAIRALDKKLRGAGPASTR